MSKTNPSPLHIVPSEVSDSADSVADDTITDEQPPQPPAPITVGQQIENYAALTSSIKRKYHLNEGTITKIFELALNERLTLMNWGLAGRNAPQPTAPAEETADGSEDPSEG